MGWSILYPSVPQEAQKQLSAIARCFRFKEILSGTGVECSGGGVRQEWGAVEVGIVPNSSLLLPNTERLKHVQSC